MAHRRGGSGARAASSCACREWFHTWVSVSIQAHRAARTSPDRASVNIGNAPDSAITAATSRSEQRSHMLDDDLLDIKHRFEPVARVVGPHLHRDVPFHPRADALAPTQRVAACRQSSPPRRASSRCAGSHSSQGSPSSYVGAERGRRTPRSSVRMASRDDMAPLSLGDVIERIAPEEESP